jgi:hypothetical protein
MFAGRFDSGTRFARWSRPRVRIVSIRTADRNLPETDRGRGLRVGRGCDDRRAAADQLCVSAGDSSSGHECALRSSCPSVAADQPHMGCTGLCSVLAKKANARPQSGRTRSSSHGRHRSTGLNEPRLERVENGADDRPPSAVRAGTQESAALPTELPRPGAQREAATCRSSRARRPDRLARSFE